MTPEEKKQKALEIIRNNKEFFSEHLRRIDPPEDDHAIGTPYIRQFIIDKSSDYTTDTYLNFNNFMVNTIKALDGENDPKIFLEYKNALNSSIKHALKHEPDKDVRPHDYVWRQEPYDTLDMFLDKHPKLVDHILEKEEVINKLGKEYKSWWEINKRRPEYKDDESFEKYFKSKHGRMPGSISSRRIKGPRNAIPAYVKEEKRIIAMNEAELKKYIEKQEPRLFRSDGSKIMDTVRDERDKLIESDKGKHQLYKRAMIMLDKHREINSLGAEGLQEYKKQLETDKGLLIKDPNSIEYQLYKHADNRINAIAESDQFKKDFLKVLDDYKAGKSKKKGVMQKLFHYSGHRRKDKRERQVDAIQAKIKEIKNHELLHKLHEFLKENLGELDKELHIGTSRFEELLNAHIDKLEALIKKFDIKAPEANHETPKKDTSQKPTHR